jgi:hypothetical protein
MIDIDQSHAENRSVREGKLMAERKQFQFDVKVNPELDELLREASGKPVSEADLREQRVSFAFGNAPQSDLITKESVRCASEHIRLKK